MKIKFENCEVDLWKLKLGVVVSKDDLIYHIDSIGELAEWCPTKEKIVSLSLKSLNTTSDKYNRLNNEITLDWSNRVTWLEPH